MKQKFSFLIDLAYDVLYLFPMTIIAAVYCYGFLGFEKPEPKIFVTALISIAILLAIRYIKGKNRLFCIGIVIEVAFFAFIFHKKGTRLDWLIANQWILWIFLACFLLYFLVQLMHHFIPVEAAVGMLLLAGLVLLLVFRMETKRVIVSLAFFLILLCGTEVVQHFWKKSGDTEKSRHLVFLSPFLLAILVLTLAIKAPEEPYDWLFFRKAYAKVVTFFDRSSVALFHGAGDSYEKAKIGFSDGGKLYGMVSHKPEDLIQVTTTKEVGNLYLSGKHFDTFDGHEWTQEDPSNMNAQTLDTVESYVAIYHYDRINPQDYIRRQTVDINYRYFNSRYIFAPMKSLLTNEKTTRLFFKFRGNDLYSDVLLNFRYPYTIYGYKLNQDNEQFREFMENLEPVDEEEWRELMWLVISYPENRPDYDYDVYQEYKVEMYRQFLPETELSDEAMAYIYEATKDGKSDYEKLLLLEEKLSEGEYTLNPGIIPPEIDSQSEWLDYFLFENNRGYCSFYATAFVLMARAMGYPARYVQGFCVPLYDDMPITVSSDQAHVWPEVYFENFGWIRFEPTPGIKIDSIWKTTDQIAKNTAVVIPEEIPIPPEEEEDIPYVPIEPVPEIVEEKTPAKYFLIPAAAILASLFLFILGKYASVRVTYNKASREEKLRIMFQRNRKLLAALGFQMIQGETLSEFRERTENELPSDLLNFLDGYELALYADKPVTTLMCMEAERSNAKIRDYLKKERGIRSWIPRLVSFMTQY